MSIEIKLTVKDVELTLTVKEARDLWRELDVLVGDKNKSDLYWPNEPDIFRFPPGTITMTQRATEIDESRPH